jgi:N-acetyl-alpha-D-glucosaminyl L-malate synthase BshA
MSNSLAIGISCYATFGGSGIIATEIGLSLARRGHRVHFICAEMPWRFDRYVDNVFFHEVAAPSYPLFEQSPYTLALSSKLVEVARYHALDLLHVHYAIPHAASAHLARQILGAQAPRLVTTLHGTDITLVGNDASYLPITRFSIEQSDGVTAPSEYLRRATYDNLSLSPERRIAVIPNFVDVDHYAPGERTTPPRLIHNSNFRPLKRVEDVVQIFACVRKKLECELVLIGDGPERSRVERLVHELCLTDSVMFLGKQLSFVEVLRGASVFLLPSEQESFGLAALEALSCGVPVVASSVGGLGELVSDGENGFLAPVGAIEQMADAALRILQDAALAARMSASARKTAERYRREPIVTRYEAFYRTVL